MGTHSSLLPCRIPRPALRLLPFCESTAQVAEAVNLNFTCGPLEFGRPAAYTESRILKTTPSPLRALISVNALRLPDSVAKALMICMPAPVADPRSCAAKYRTSAARDRKSSPSRSMQSNTNRTSPTCSPSRTQSGNLRRSRSRCASYLLAVKDAVGQLAHLERDLLRQRYDLALTVDAKDVAAQLLGHAALAVHLLLHHVGRVLEIHLQIRLFDGIQELRLVAGRGALVGPDAGEDLDRGAHRLISLSYLCVAKGVEDLPGLGVGHRLAGLGAGLHRATTAAVRKVHLQAIGNRYDLGLINFV